MKTTLRSSELSCPSCIAKIEKSLKSLDGVTNAKVYFTTGRIEVEHDPERVSTDMLAKSVRDVGYNATVAAF